MTPEMGDHHAKGAVDDALQGRGEAVEAFFAAHGAQVKPPVYASADIRHAGHKAAAVDTNAFPAGFNNLCATARDAAAAAMHGYFSRHHPDARFILLLPEDHTRNPFYLQNVHFLATVLDAAGLEHAIGSADPAIVADVRSTPTPDGDLLQYQLVTRQGGRTFVGDRPVDLILSNNDFTTGVPRPLSSATEPIIPHPEMGWDHRSKAKHFALYNHLATQLADRIGVDPWLLTIDTRVVRGVDFKGREGLDGVAGTVEDVLSGLANKMDTHGVKGTPKVFVKDDAGTYGMGITVVSDAEEIRALNNRARQRMDKGKYGHKVARVIVQEAVPTIERVKGAAAEPVFYMVGGKPVGAFMRIHDEKGDADNLNQPGMRFLPMCEHRACTPAAPGAFLATGGSPAEETAAALAALALAYEATEAVRRAPGAREVPLPALA